MLSIQRCGNSPGDRFRGAPQWVVIKMSVTCGCRCLSMAQQATNDRKTKPATGTKARISVPQIVEAYAGQTGPLCDGIPRTFQIVARLFRIIAGHRVWTQPLQPVQYRKPRSIQDNGLSAALAVGQEKAAAFKIDVLPPQVQDFPQAAAGEEK